MVLQIQIASDLHIEYYKETTIPDDIIVPKAPNLALLGDIGLAHTDQLQNFLYQQADHFQNILFVAGNYEFYNFGTMHKAEEQLAWIK